MRILAIGAHPDDVELGCGGALALFKKKGHDVNVLVLTRGEASGDPVVRENECKVAAATIGVDRLLFGNLVDTRITDGIDTIKTIEDTMDGIAPEFVFTHSPKDSHQDHRNTLSCIDVRCSACRQSTALRVSGSLEGFFPTSIH